MKREHRQTLRHVEAFAKHPPKEVTAAIWQDILALVNDCVEEAKVGRQRADHWAARLSEFEGGVNDQLSEERAKNVLLSSRVEKLSAACRELGDIAQKDRPAGWKTLKNGDYIKLVEIENAISA